MILECSLVSVNYSPAVRWHMIKTCRLGFNQHFILWERRRACCLFRKKRKHAFVCVCVWVVCGWGVGAVIMKQQSNIQWPAQSHFLNQCWNIVNLTLSNKIQWNIKQNSHNFAQINAFEEVTYNFTQWYAFEILDILPQSECVKHQADTSTCWYLIGIKKQKVHVYTQMFHAVCSNEFGNSFRDWSVFTTPQT